MKVAQIGTGRMGAAMAGRLAAAGHELVVYNRTRSRAEQVAAETGAEVADSAREAGAFAEVCVVSLADDASLEAAYLGPQGLVAGLARGVVVCETSTVTPALVRELALQVAERGATLIDTPVSGSVSVVESGALTVMAGGDALVIDQARPVLSAFANRIFPMGDTGSGAAMKLVVNSLVHALNVAVSEALVLGERAGLDRATVYDVFEAGAAGAPFVTYKREAFLHPGEVPVAFSLDLVAKDLDLIHELATSVSARMDQAEASRRLVTEAVRAGLSDRDLSEIAAYLR